MEPYEIFLRTVDSAEDCRGSIDDAVQACERSGVRVEARYLHRWRTPMAGARFRLWVNESLELDGATLRDFADVGLSPGRPPTTPSEKERWAELGTYLHQPSRDGRVRMEIVTDTRVEPERQELRDAIHARLDGAYHALRDAMRPYQEQWQRYGMDSIPLAQAQGFLEAGTEWVVELGELFTEQYWRETGEAISSAFWWTLGTAEEAIEGAGERIMDVYEHREILVDRAWWGSVAEGAAAHVEATAEQTKQMISGVRSGAPGGRHDPPPHRARQEGPRHVVSGCTTTPSP